MNSKSNGLYDVREVRVFDSCYTSGVSVSVLIFRRTLLGYCERIGYTIIALSGGSDT